MTGLDDVATIGRTRGWCDLDDRVLTVGGGDGWGGGTTDGLFALRFAGRGLRHHRKDQLG